MATDNSTQPTTDKTQYKWENDYYKNLYDEGVKNLNKEYLDTALKAVSQQNQAAYALRKQEQQQAEQSFYQQLYNTNQTVMDTLRKNNAAAIASGASKGTQAANELSAILQGQQTGVQASTDLANENYNLAAEAQQTGAQNTLTATEAAQNAAAQAALGLANTLQTDQNQWVENQISNYLAELASGNTTDSEGSTQALSQTDWLQRAGWLKAHNVDIDFKNDEGYKNTYNKLFAAQDPNASNFTMTAKNDKSKDISETTNNAARVYKFSLNNSDYQVKAAFDQPSTEGAAGWAAGHIAGTKTNADVNAIKGNLDKLPNNSYLGFTKKDGNEVIIYKQSEDNIILFLHGDGYNSTTKNNKGFTALWDSLSSSGKTITL